uniref:Solute carrier family 26 member 6 n=1 Tax=Mastacembelus armatus TaxID=205130 RepID=A0A7N8XA24_9TELE
MLQLVLAMAERRWVGYNVQRQILDEEAVDEMAEKSESKVVLSESIKKSMRCSGPRLKSCLLDSIPVLSWLPRYPVKDNALSDLISGISVGVMHLPQGMAYALLAAVPPVFGLYSSFYPVLIYFIFGTSKHISVGTYAVMSVMIGSVTEQLAPESNFMQWDNGTNTSIVDETAMNKERVKVAAAVTFLSGLFQILLGLVRFGFVVTYLSEPLVRGYTTGAAIHVIVSQLKYTFGTNPLRHSGPLSLIYTVLEVSYLIPKTNVGTLVVSVVTIIGLMLAKQLSVYLNKKLPVPIPVELLTIIIATIISWQVGLEQKYGVDVVGDIPSGLQPPVLPDATVLGQVIGNAFALAVVGYGMVISLGRIFALKYGYKVDSNQELIALGLSNSIGGIFQCFAISCSMSRTMVQHSTGGKTQAVLAAIIYVNLSSMMKQFTDIPALWKTNRVDMLIWVVTFILTLLLNPDLGLAASIGFSMLTVIFRTQLQVPGILIFRCSATLYFANAEMYQDALAEKSGIDITKKLAIKKKLEAKRKRHEKKIARKARKAAKKNTVNVVRKTMLSLLTNVLTSWSSAVVDNLQTGGFFNEKVTKSCVFSTIHDAVLHCQSTRMSQHKVMPCLHTPITTRCTLLLI